MATGAKQDEITQVEVHMAENRDTEENTTFSFEEWAKKSGLNRKTTSVLRGEDLNTEISLCHVTEEDILVLPLTTGQRRLLLVAVTSLQTSSQSESVNHDIVTTPVRPATVDKQDIANPGSNLQTRASGLDVLQEQVTVSDFRAQQDNLFTAGKELDILLSAHTNDNNSNSTPCAINEQMSYLDPRSILTTKAHKVKAVHITQNKKAATSKTAQFSIWTKK